MTTRTLLGAITLAGMLVACTENTAPGNDRAADLEPPARAAEIASASTAISNVAPGLLLPQTMTDPDVASLPAASDACRFRMTRVGFPVAVYDGAGAYIKLNDKLVRLDAAGGDRYSAGGIDVTLRTLEREEGPGLSETEFVLRLPGAPNELGFRGYAEC